MTKGIGWRSWYYAGSAALTLSFPLFCRWCGDANIPPQKAFARFWINLIFLNLLLAYLLFFQKTNKIKIVTRSEWILFAAAGLFLCVLPPVFSGDLHEYLMRGRILGVYHENPYLVPREYPGDPFYSLTTWVSLNKLPENYGPVWACIEWIVPTIFRHSYFASIFFFKALLFSFLAGAVWFFDRICREMSPAHAHWLVPFFALNPNLINHTLIDGHNDIVMVFWSLGAFYFLLKNRYARAVAAATLAVLVKFTTVIFLPLTGIFYFRGLKEPSVGKFLGITAKSLAIFAAICFAFYLPFWTGASPLSYFSMFMSNWFYSNSVPYAFYMILNRLGLEVSQDAVKHFFMFFFAANCLLAFIWLWAKKNLAPRDFCRAASWIFLAMYSSYPIPFYGHHLLWALPFLILAEFPAPLLWNLLYTAVGLFFYFKRPSFLFLAGFVLYSGYLLFAYFAVKAGRKSLDSPVKKSYNKASFWENL